MKRWYIRLDTQKQKDNELITMVKQDKYSNELNINLVNNGKPIDLTNTSTIAIMAKKPDGNEVVGSCRVADVKKGLVVYVVDYQAISAIGINIFTIKIVDINQVMTTTSFVVRVIEDPFTGTDGSIESTSDYPVLTGLMENTSNMLDEAGKIRETKEHLDKFAIVRNEDNDNSDIIPLDAGLFDGREPSYYATNIELLTTMTRSKTNEIIVSDIVEVE